MLGRRAMIFTGKKGSNDRWRDGKPRPLGDAARLARAMAKAEGWPIAGVKAGRSDAWYCAAMLETIPVMGTHASARKAQALSASARGLMLSDDANALFGRAEPGPVWRDLFVERKAFDRFLDYLRSFY